MCIISQLTNIYLYFYEDIITVYDIGIQAYM